MKRKLLSLVLAMGLTAVLATPALAAEPADIAAKFPAVNSYEGFPDVPAGSWFEDGARICCETGLMNGTGGGFAPGRTVTVAEIAAIAARLREAVTGDAIPKAEGEGPWYTPYVNYLKSKSIPGLDSPDAAATRFEALALLGAVITDQLLPPINQITTLPDASDWRVLRFYNAGVTTGVDLYGTFLGDKTLTRAEVASLLSRVVRPELRQSFTPLLKGDDMVYDLMGVPSGTVAITAGPVQITLGEYLSFAVYYADQLRELCQQQGVPFAWSNTVDGVDFRSYVTSHANTRCLQLQWRLAKMPVLNLEQLGQVEQLYQDQRTARGGEDGFRAWLAQHALTREEYRLQLSDAARSQAILDGFQVDEGKFQEWLTENGILRAKHVLVESREKAIEVRAQLGEGEGEGKFDTLMRQYSLDLSGLELYPDGFTFGPGEMDPAFEQAVRDLPVGGISQPVETSFGWHIILRLKPHDRDYRREMLEDQFSAWLKTLPTPEGSDLYQKLDESAFYQSVLELREK